jgi:ubiquinone/menaquinone biosynthesis C-methylase UbiE
LVIGARDFHKLDAPERKEIQDIKSFINLVKSFRWKTCADLGCGVGFYTLPLAEEWRASRRIIAVDRSTPMLEELDRRIDRLELTNVQIRQSVSDRIPIEDSFVELANLGNVYNEIKGRLNFLKEVYRILKPGGTLLLIDWDPEEDLGFGPPVNEMVPVPSVMQDLEFAGFSGIKQHFVFIGHYGLSARKPRQR